MFENIIGQGITIEILKKELLAKNLPRALLFSGPQYTGKLSTALETARVLTCHEEKGEWNCSCKACRDQRVLSHADTLLLGPHDFNVEIAAAADVLRRTRKLSAQYIFIRAVRKLTRRFDQILWEGEDSKIRKVQPLIAELEERLDAFSPDSDLPEKEELEKGLERIMEVSLELIPVLSADNIPINQIRRASYWSHLSTTGSNKVLILENADRMHESSRNSLLKILEEPPEDVFLILLTGNKGAMISTILSRVRSYSFVERSIRETREVLRRIFQEEDEKYLNLRNYFSYWQELNPEIFTKLVRKYVDLLLADKKEDLDVLTEMKTLLSTKEKRSSVSFFLEELVNIFYERYKSGQLSPSRLQRWLSLTQNKHTALNRLNLNPNLVIESLFYSLSECAQ